MFKLEDLRRADQKIKDLLRQDSRLKPGAIVPIYEEQNKIAIDLNEKAYRIADHEGLTGLARPFVRICLSKGCEHVDILWHAESDVAEEVNEKVGECCDKPSLINGPRVPARYGSYATVGCANCKKWRIPDAGNDSWRTDPIEDHLERGDDEL